MKGRIGIIAAMKEESQELIQNIQGREEHLIGPFHYYTGTLWGRQVCVLQCGIGKVNAGIGAALMLEKWPPAFVLNTGVAGGLHQGLKEGDIVLSTEILYHDVMVNVPGQLPGLPPVFLSDSRLLERAKGVQLRDSTIQVMEGIIATGDVFITDPEQIQKVKSNFPKAIAVEMEAAAIAHACHLFKTPFMMIRAISDVVEKEGSETDFDTFLSIAAKNSVDFVEKFINLSLV